MNDEQKMFEKLVEKASKENNMEILYLLVMTLITADNNLTEEELTENCRQIDMLIEILENYKDLQEIRDMLIDYRSNITL
jgi:hypothetical protein